MRLLHIHRHLAISHTLHSTFWRFELSVWIHVVARSLIAIFIPALLIEHGYSVREVIYYYCIFNIIDVPLNFLAFYLIKKTGARWVIALGTISSAIYFIILGFLQKETFIILLILAFFDALYDALYWVSHLYFFIQAEPKKRKINEDMGTLNIVKQLGSVIGPFLGAVLVLSPLGSNGALIFTIILLLISLVPLFYIRHVIDKPLSEKLPSPRKFFRSVIEKKNHWSLALNSMHGTVDGIIWPLFIFLTIGSIKSLALLSVAISIAGIAVTYLSVRSTALVREKELIGGGIVLIGVWILRIVIELRMFHFISALLMSLFGVLVNVPIDTDLIERAKQLGPLASATYRNAISMAAQALLFIMLIFLTEFFKISFAIAAFCLFVLVIITYIFLSHVKHPKHLNI